MPSSFARFLPRVALATLLLSPAAWADDPKLPPPQKDTLQAVLDRIKQHAANDAWKQPGFKDDEIERYLDRLVGTIAKATDFPDLKSPVRLKDMRAVDPARVNDLGLSGALIVGKNLDLRNRSVQSCIILADGNIDLLRATDSILVARGVVSIGNYTKGSVIAAGTLVKHEDSDGDPQNLVNGSVIVSRGWLEIGSTYGTLMAAPAGITSTAITPQRGWYLNAPVPAERPGNFAPPRGNGNRSIQVPDLPLELLPIHPLGAKLRVLGVMYSRSDAKNQAWAANRDDYQPSGVMLEFGGKRILADLGRPITNEAGGGVEGLHGWQLATISDKLIILSSPDADAFVRFDLQAGKAP